MEQNFEPEKVGNTEDHEHKRLLYAAVGIVLVIVIVLAAMFIFGRKEVAPVEEPPELTDEERLIQSMTATGPSTITSEEAAALNASMSASGGSTLSPAELTKLRDSMTPKKK